MRDPRFHGVRVPELLLPSLAAFVGRGMLMPEFEAFVADEALARIDAEVSRLKRKRLRIAARLEHGLPRANE